MVGIPNNLPKFLKVVYPHGDCQGNGVIIDAGDSEVSEELRRSYLEQYELASSKQSPIDLPVMLKCDSGECLIVKIKDISTLSMTAVEPDTSLDVASELQKIYASVDLNATTKDGEPVGELLRELLFKISNKNWLINDAFDCILSEWILIKNF